MTAKIKKEKKSILLENTFLPFGVEMLFSWFIIVLFTMYLHLQTRSYRFVPSSLKLFFNDFSVGKIEPIKNTSCITMIIMLNIPIVSSLAP